MVMHNLKLPGKFIGLNNYNFFLKKFSLGCD